MISAARIHRGFHRVGVVLAALALLLVAFMAVQNERSAALALVVIAALLYAAACAVGWVLAGLIGSNGTTSP